VWALFDELVCLPLMGETTLRASFLSAPWLIYETTYLLRMQECRVMRSCNSFSGGRAPLGWDTDSLICLLGPQTQKTFLLLLLNFHILLEFFSCQMQEPRTKVIFKAIFLVTRDCTWKDIRIGRHWRSVLRAGGQTTTHMSQ
jgi:hypothetical protein